MAKTQVPLGEQPVNTLPITERGITPTTSQSTTPTTGQNMTPVTNGNNTITPVDPSSVNNINNIDPSIMDSIGKNPTDRLNNLPKPSENTGDTGKQNLYNDVINANKERPQYAGSGGDSSSGAAAASGTQYSWDKQGMDAAQNQYQQDALKAKQDALANRQTLEQNSLQYQQQADMMQYTNNQEAEKVGWTGGYVLDQNRQMEYLKSSIQAQMYGAMELQKYGYDSALAAARLSYDLNQKEFAHKYYQEAVNTAITEAQITGTYFSAETRDMMSQYNVAMQELKGINIADMSEIELLALTTEQKRALEIKKNIDSWYKANNVSTTGVQTLAAWQTEQSMIQQWAESQWTKFQAAMASAKNEETEDANAFIMLDKEGNPIYDGASVQVGNFRTMTAKEILDYVNNTSSEGKEQVYGYIDGLFEKDITSYVSSAKTITNADGTTTTQINSKDLEKIIKDNTKVSELGSILGGYDYTTKAGDSTVNIKVNTKGEIQVEITKTNSSNSSNNGTKVEDIESNPNNKLIKTEELAINQSGDRFSNDAGNRKPGDNCSLTYNEDTLRVQTGAQVKYGSALDEALNNYSTKQGSAAIVNGVLYVRDNSCWYVVEAREDGVYKEHWDTLRKAYNLNYTKAPSYEDYTQTPQGVRPDSGTKQDKDGNATYWSGNVGSNAQWMHSGEGDNYTITVKNKDYSVTVVWGDYTSIKGDSANGLSIEQIRDTSKYLGKIYPEPVDGDVVYYGDNYWIYQSDGGNWGLLVTGDEQDKDASDADAFIKAVTGK